jgi:hypothetical protein
MHVNLHFIKSSTCSLYGFFNFILYLSLILTESPDRLAKVQKFCTVCTSSFNIYSLSIFAECIYKNVYRVVLAANSDYGYIPRRHYPIGRCEVVATRMSVVEAVDPQRVLQFPASCGTGRFMAAVATALLYSITRTRRIQAMSCRRI